MHISCERPIDRAAYYLRPVGIVRFVVLPATFGSTARGEEFLVDKGSASLR